MLTANVEGKSIGDIYFNKIQDLKLFAHYSGNGVPTPDSYRWNIGGQYDASGSYSHTILSTSIANTPAGDYTLTVTAMNGSCPLQTVSYTVHIIDCPYTGDDLLLDASHTCGVAHAPQPSSSTYYQAYITASAQTYRIVQINNLWWFAENSKSGTAAFSNGGINYYKETNARSGACPTNWTLPASGQWSSMISATGATNNYGEALRSTTFGGGTDLYGFSAIATGYYDNTSQSASAAQAYFWLSDSGGSKLFARIYSNTNNPDNGSTSDDNAYPVRCVRQ
jgi:uncharacterized protein (TIGR02145 family)